MNQRKGNTIKRSRRTIPINVTFVSIAASQQFEMVNGPLPVHYDDDGVDDDDDDDHKQVDLRRVNGVPTCSKRDKVQVNPAVQIYASSQWKKWIKGTPTYTFATATNCGVRRAQWNPFTGRLSIIKMGK
ncbi:unnamed protein product [Dibothriocephalus latus]|uniref:Uncharacterized protein n=1 Tax=Dibothriocephalus latus TaxID=60516 RepID=A0A3P7PKM3_DIBLA|nr:unnamed protein product [Dibothriocephalus latus]